MIKHPLRLNLQFFNDEDVETQEVVEDTNTDTELNETPDDKKDEKVFTQADLDRILKDRLNRDRKAREEADEKKRLEEQGKFKELLEKANAKIEQLENEKALSLRNNLINEKLIEKGLDGAQAKRYAKYVEKLVETDEDVDNAVEAVYNDFVATTQQSYGDPNAGFGEKKQPKQKSEYDLGKELFERIKR